MRKDFAVHVVQNGILIENLVAWPHVPRVDDVIAVGRERHIIESVVWRDKGPLVVIELHVENKKS